MELIVKKKLLGVDIDIAIRHKPGLLRYCDVGDG